MPAPPLQLAARASSVVPVLFLTRTWEFGTNRTARTTPTIRLPRYHHHRRSAGIARLSSAQARSRAQADHKLLQMEQAGRVALKPRLPDRMDERSPASPGSQDAPLGPQMDTPAPAGPDAVTGFPFGAAGSSTRHGRNERPAHLPERFRMGRGERIGRREFSTPAPLPTSPLKVGGDEGEADRSASIRSPPTFRGEGWEGGTK